MLSAILAIASSIVVIVAIFYFVTNYLPSITEFCNSIFDNYTMISELIPPWLAIFALIPLLLFVIGVIIKLL